jgi:hypothetical protein
MRERCIFLSDKNNLTAQALRVNAKKGPNPRTKGTFLGDAQAHERIYGIRRLAATHAGSMKEGIPGRMHAHTRE